MIVLRDEGAFLPHPGALRTGRGLAQPFDGAAYEAQNVPQACPGVPHLHKSRPRGILGPQPDLWLCKNSSSLAVERRPHWPAGRA